MTAVTSAAQSIGAGRRMFWDEEAGIGHTSRMARKGGTGLGTDYTWMFQPKCSGKSNYRQDFY